MRIINDIIGFFVRLYLALKERFTRPREKKVMRLAVVGSTGCGKTYLLCDIIGSLEKLGCRRDDKYNDGTLHRDAYDLIENQKHNGGIDKTLIHACRQEDIYCSRFIDNLGNRMTIQFTDIPGEVMTPESMSMFRAVMKALMACRNRLFLATDWDNPKTHKTVRVIELIHSETSNMAVSGLGGKLSFSNGGRLAADAQGQVYVGTSARKAYYERQDFHEGRQRKISGADLFLDFLHCDVDSVINAIIEAWELLKIDDVLPQKLKAAASGSGKSLFQNEYKNHFFFHYNTFFATDVVVCDKCCMPVISDEKEVVNDRFTTMMQVLRNLTNYKDAPAKKWYLAMKGIDAVMREEKWREVYQCSEQDLNLVYSHFLVLFRQACEHGLLADGTVPATYTVPFSSPERMMDWLTKREWDVDEEEETTEDGGQLVSLLDGHYRRFAADVDLFFKRPEEYVMLSAYDLSEHVRRRVDDFCHLDDSQVADDPEKRDERRLLNLPPHVYFIATPIDNEFHICGHCADDPTLFEGDASHYNHRAGFGALQLTTDILLAHGAKISEKYNCFGYVLDHVHDQA
ncbi:MAG: hypothetical protein IKI36_05110 [Prevotella sp.]|nr:hypothetical protein [Prevotella sp.]